MVLNYIFNYGKRCTHSLVPIDQEYSYCPECGELIENRWYLVRCKVCGLKQIATAKNGEVMPVNNFCRNCGSHEYTVERLEKIDCINVNYAVLVQEIMPNNGAEYFQCWSDISQTLHDKPKLLR